MRSLLHWGFCQADVVALSFLQRHPPHPYCVVLHAPVSNDQPPFLFISFACYLYVLRTVPFWGTSHLITIYCLPARSEAARLDRCRCLALPIVSLVRVLCSADDRQCLLLAKPASEYGTLIVAAIALPSRPKTSTATIKWCRSRPAHKIGVHALPLGLHEVMKRPSSHFKRKGSARSRNGRELA